MLCFFDLDQLCMRITLNKGPKKEALTKKCFLIKEISIIKIKNINQEHTRKEMKAKKGNKALALFPFLFTTLIFCFL